MSNVVDLSDEKVILKVISENQELYAVIINRYQDKLFRYALNMLQNEHEAADIVQQAFIKAYINLKGFNLNKKFSSWIYRIVHNETINHIKKYQNEVTLPEDIDFKSNENVELDFEQKEIAEQVEKCFSKLPLIYAEPLRLHFIDEKSYEEISDILKIPMGTVATRINRAKKLIKPLCQKN